METTKDVSQLTRDELYWIIKKGNDKDYIKLCIEEEDRRINILIQEKLKKEAEARERLVQKAV
jgi:hypothetical protein